MSTYLLSRSPLGQLSRIRIPVRLLCMAGAPLLLSGCVTFSPDGGMSVVANVAGHELRKDVVAIRTPQDADQANDAVRALLRRPLTADTAVQIALLNNRGLQAAYNELGIAEANRVQASLPPNPTVSVGRLSGPAEIEIEKRIVANILSLATLPARTEIATQRFTQAQLRAAEETLRVAADTRRAYYRAVAQRQLAGFLTQANSAAEIATKLGRRLGETGAMNKLDQARDQVFYAELTAQLATARQRATSERERLTRLLGLWGVDANLKLPGTLAALPRRPLALPDIEVEAIRRRVDLQIARIEVDVMARSYGLGQATRFINLLEVAGISKTKKERGTGERVRDDGFELEFQIPIFDFGEVRVRQAEQSYMHAVNRLDRKGGQCPIRSTRCLQGLSVDLRYCGPLPPRNHPASEIISDETLLRYNAMMVDVFALLAEARQRINSNVAAIEAQREFWLASVDLTTAVTGGGVAGGGGTTTAAAAGGEPAGH